MIRPDSLLGQLILGPQAKPVADVVQAPVEHTFEERFAPAPDRFGRRQDWLSGNEPRMSVKEARELEQTVTAAEIAKYGTDEKGRLNVPRGWKAPYGFRGVINHPDGWTEGYGGLMGPFMVSEPELKTALETRARYEHNFQTGIRSTEWFKEYVKEFGEEPDLDTPDYDYRAAWEAGARPDVRDPKDGRYHWPSEFKGDNHPNRFIDGIDTKTGKPVKPIADQYSVPVPKERLSPKWASEFFEKQAAVPFSKDARTLLAQAMAGDTRLATILSQLESKTISDAVPRRLKAQIKKDHPRLKLSDEDLELLMLLGRRL